MVIHYKCPNCGSDMKFDAESGTLSCPSCGHQDNIETFSEDLIHMSLTEEDAKEYHCDNCGAVILTDPDTVATNCSFCDAGVVLAERVSGTLAPAKVIPFMISKEEAAESFRKWCRKGKLAPQEFKAANRIKSITGMYVPFWLYDFNSKIDVSATATKIRTYSRGDYDYTETSYYDVYRKINLEYEKVPADASMKMDDALMDKLEPYYYNELKDFKTPYLAGYLAEKYQYDDKELQPRAASKISDYIDTYIHSTFSGYSSINYEQKKIDTNRRRAYYTLLPVWMVYYDFAKSEHIFAMNGQTGKVVGKPPISWGKAGIWFGGIAATVFLALKTASFAMGGGFW